MKRHNLKDFKRGWFVGDFEPSLVKSQNIEVAVQTYNAGARQPEHVHKIAREFTVIISGLVNISGIEYGVGDIVEISPGERAAFTALEPTITVVVKCPSVKNDKYLTD